MLRHVRLLVVSAGRRNGHVERALTRVVKNALQEGGSTSWLFPPLKDGQDVLLSSQAIVIGTPAHWFSVPAVLKSWIDSLTELADPGWKLEGKVAGAFVYGPEGGAGNVAQYLGWVFNNMGMIVPPYGLIWQEGQKSSHNAWVPWALDALGKNVVELAKAKVKWHLDE